MEINGREVPKINVSKFKSMLKAKRNLLIYGQSGLGKTSIVIAYAKENNLKLKIVNLAVELPEAVGGLPYATKEGYYTKLLSIELADVFENEGEGYVILFDEINQAAPEVLNTLYGICHPFGEQRNWAGHSLAKAQIVACGNLMDGTDGTVYLNELPTPLHDRFHVNELVANRKETVEYLVEKWKNLPQVSTYVNVMYDGGINSRTMDECLDVLAKGDDPQFLIDKIGTALTMKILDLQKGLETIDPAELIKNARNVYAKLKARGTIILDGKRITTEAQLRDKFATFLTEEEIKSVMEGGE